MNASRALLPVMIVAGVAGCSVPGPGGAPDGIHDPYEAQNRRVHEFNRQVDQKVFGGDGPGYTGTVPEEVQVTITNFADTVSLPKTIVNQILHGRPGDATRNTVRFTINATLGFAGLADVATDLGLPRDETDFGATLAAWGVPEGAYLELPVLGPSTERDAAGDFVGLFTDPLAYLVPTPERYIGTAAKVLDKVGERSRFGDTVDSVLYESADGYAQLLLMYLQNRRFELGEAAPGDDFDPLAVDIEGF